MSETLAEYLIKAERGHASDAEAPAEPEGTAEPESAAEPEPEPTEGDTPAGAPEAEPEPAAEPEQLPEPTSADAAVSEPQPEASGETRVERLEHDVEGAAHDVIEEIDAALGEPEV
jgi:hypothetical protein